MVQVQLSLDPLTPNFLSERLIVCPTPTITTHNIVQLSLDPLTLRTQQSQTITTHNIVQLSLDPLTLRTQQSQTITTHNIVQLSLDPLTLRTQQSLKPSQNTTCVTSRSYSCAFVTLSLFYALPYNHDVSF